MDKKSNKLYLPNGKYLAQLSSTGNHNYFDEDGKEKYIWFFNWKVTEGPYVDDTFSTSLWPCSSKALNMYKHIMRIMGCDPDVVPCNDPNVLVGRSCFVTIEQTKPPYHKSVRYDPLV